MDASLQPKLPKLNNQFSVISDAGAVCSHSCASTRTYLASVAFVETLLQCKQPLPLRFSLPEWLLFQHS